MDNNEQPDVGYGGRVSDQDTFSSWASQEYWSIPTFHAGEVERLLFLRWRYRTGRLTEWDLDQPPSLPDDLWVQD